MTSDNKPSPTERYTLRILFLSLLGWSIFLAVGSLIFARSMDFRKPLIVLATMGVFLGTWWLALKWRR